MTNISYVSTTGSVGGVSLDRAEEVRQVALKLEASFLAEMLKSAGFGEQRNSFSGGEGEDQFASFHRHAIAERIASSGGIGLAAHFYRSMMETQ